MLSDAKKKTRMEKLQRTLRYREGERCLERVLQALAAYQHRPDQSWAGLFIDLITAIQKQVLWLKQRQLPLSLTRQQAYARCLEEIIQLGLWLPANRSKPPSNAPRGAKPLLDYVRFHKNAVLASLYHDLVVEKAGEAPRQ